MGVHARSYVLCCATELVVLSQLLRRPKIPIGCLKRNYFRINSGRTAEENKEEDKIK